MPVILWEDVSDQLAVRSFVLNHYTDEAVSQKRGIVQIDEVRANLAELIDQLPDYGAQLFIAQDQDTEVIAGYALTTEHSNKWAGWAEGFIYLFWLAPSAMNSGLALDLLDQIQTWGIRGRYKVLRVEIRMSTHSQTLLQYLGTMGWATSAIIPCKLLSSLDLDLPDQGVDIGEEIRIRAAQTTDYSFIAEGLAQAAWDAVSEEERKRVASDTFLANAEEDFITCLASQDSHFALVVESARDGIGGYAVARDGFADAMLGIPEAELVDVSLIPNLRGRGIADTLTLYTLHRCWQRGAMLVRGTIGTENTTPVRVQQICDDLETKGWWFYSQVLCKCLPRS